MINWRAALYALITLVGMFIFVTALVLLAAYGGLIVYSGFIIGFVFLGLYWAFKDVM